MTHQDIVERGRRVLRMETEALGETERRIGDDLRAQSRCIARSRAGSIVSGVGKSGLVGRKIAATLTSTGTPATFLHPADSVHGDLGIVGESDVAILISKSGESAEVVGLLDHLKRLGVCTIALTGNAKSTLARHSDVALDGWVKEEACPHDLAPTTSTTVALALGDALAIALLEEKGFDADDFAQASSGRVDRQAAAHQGLGRDGDRQPSDTSRVGNHARGGSTAGRAPRNRGRHRRQEATVAGVITTGDLSRLMEHEENVFPIPGNRSDEPKPKIARDDELGSAVVYRMETHGIIAMPVLDADDRVVGVIHLHDLMRAGVV